MKKLFTILALVAFSTVTFSACTEEEVKPASTDAPKGGAGSSGVSSSGF